jgi:ComF family protein
MAGQAGGLLSAFLNLVYPPYCVACHRRSEWFCADCRSRIVPMSLPLCPRCGQTLRASSRCPSCLPADSALAGIRSLGPYRAPLSDAIHALKYQGLRVLARPLAEQLAQFWQVSALPVDAVMPVPLHPARQRARGYNQSALLARGFGALMGLPVREDLVARDRHTRPQVGLGRDDRLSNVRGAFVLRTRFPRGMRILLVDDVLTTGATLEACAQPLLDAGAASVYALTLARSTLADDTAPTALA